MSKKEGKLAKGTRPPRANVFEVVVPYKLMIFGLILFALLSNGVNLVLPKIISHSIDSYVAGTFSYKTMLVQFGSAGLVIFIFTLLQGLVQTYASERVARDIRTKLADKISRQSYAYMLQSNPSKLLTNLTSDVDSIKVFVSIAIVSLASSIFIIIGASILLLSINWKLALVVLVIIPIIISAFMFVFKKLGAFFKRSRELVDRLNKVINENIVGAALVRVLNSQTMEYRKFMEVNTDIRNNGMSIVKLFATLIPIVVFVGNLAALVILVLGGHFVITNAMSLGDFAAFSSYLAILIFPIIVIGFISNFVAQASVAYARIKQVLDSELNTVDGENGGKLLGDISFRNVEVYYGAKPVLKNVSFEIKAGTRSAIIGPTAAGKTQLLYLLTGLLTPNKGEVLLDGLPIDSYDKTSMQQQIGFVFQDSVMFNLSVKENIAFNENVTDAMLQKAIKTAELDDFIDALPQGINTIISERGTSLSGGQKQRIMLARALALNPQILLLDDFTARVDSNTEQKILANLQANYPDITLLAITQKVASVTDYEQVILLEEGEVLATGTHDKLMKESTEYVQIYNSQRSTNQIEK
ncbi:MAG: ABC transporter ATP-binding protein [Porphyromonadaceae bacterium CG2_30_38_12]|nr:MAG: ABC transporter ATP-binding protein [Porphyromonadaceae bacterium CG2_30_38_12]